MNDCFQSWILPAFGDRDVENITHLDVIEFRKRMLDRALSPNRQYSIIMALKTYLAFCRKVLKIPALDPAEVRLPKRGTPNVQALTNADVQAIRKAISIDSFLGLRLRAFVEIGLQTGLRLSEILGLDRAPFERGDREIQIIGKGNKVRTVFFPAPCLEWIYKFIHAYRRQDDCQALFVTTGFPRRLQPYDVSKVFRSLRREAGIEKHLTPHMLRHTYCTNLLLHGADITFIQKLAGHADIQTTAKYYLSVDREALRNVVKNCLNYDSEPLASASG